MCPYPTSDMLCRVPSLCGVLCHILIPVIWCNVSVVLCHASYIITSFPGLKYSSCPLTVEVRWSGTPCPVICYPTKWGEVIWYHVSLLCCAILIHVVCLLSCAMQRVSLLGCQAWSTGLVLRSRWSKVKWYTGAVSANVLGEVRWRSTVSLFC